MAAHVPTAPGYHQMLKLGAKYFSGLQESVYSNITACRALASCLRTCYGPCGYNKLIINHLGKVFFTSDASTILKELELENPAARMLRIAAQSQEEEVGDGTNFVILLAGALLENAEGLLRAGLSVAEVTLGYKQASEKALEFLQHLCCSTLEDSRDAGQVAAAIRTAINSKTAGYTDFLSKLIAECCVSALPQEGEFDTDSIRVCKIPGADILQSYVLSGMLFQQDTEGIITAVNGARIAIYSCTFGLASTETKSTVLIQNPLDMVSFSSGLQQLTERHINRIANTGVNVIVVAGKVEDLALYYADRYKLMVVKITSRHEMQSLRKVVRATPLLTLTPPLQTEIGSCDHVYLSEIGDAPVVVFKQEKGHPPVSTIILRGATNELLSSVAEAITDAIRVYKTLTVDKRLVPGAGATEIDLCVKLQVLGMKCPGMEHYGILEFARALESIPRALAENAGLKINQVIAKLKAAHHLRVSNIGVGSDEVAGCTIDALKARILDPFLVKAWAIKLAAGVAVTLLNVNQIVMAKKSGGPRFKGENPNWDAEPDHID